MKQTRYRELRYRWRNIKKPLGRCKVCGKPIELDRVMEHLECGRKVIQAKER